MGIPAETPRTIIRFRSTGSPVLDRVVRQWLRNVERISRDWQSVGDLPWSYTERPLLSIFAGGVWKLGGVAVEEYVSQKRGRDGRRVPSTGREDLYFALGGREFKAECKHLWSAATRASPDATVVRLKLREAVDDARRCSADGQRRLGILFATPYVSKRQPETLEKRIDHWVKNVFGNVPCTAAGVIFPRQVRSSCGEGYDHYLPGAAIFIQKV
jgi:hypothetical protein